MAKLCRMCLDKGSLPWFSGYTFSNYLVSFIQEGELDAVGIVHSYEDDLPAGSHKTRLTALNVCLVK